MATIQLGKIDRAVHFRNDRLYTFGALIEELALAERHCRDLSYLSCSCIPEKHLPLIAGLASEGFGFAESEKEKTFMRNLMNVARVFNDKISKGLIRSADCEKLRAWAREMRHRIEYGEWLGKLSETPELEEDVPESIREMVSSLRGLETANPLSLPEIEEETAWRMIRFLADKHGVPPPKKITFVDSCNPFYPNAAHIQRDKVTGDGLEPKPELDELVFCRGSLTAFAAVHEFKHYLDHFNGETVADEAEANEFALAETRNNLYTEKGGIHHKKNNLYTGTASDKGYIATTRNNYTDKPMAIDKKKGTTVFVGLATAKLADKYLSPQLDTVFGAMASMGKLALGAGLTYFGLTKERGMVGDIVTFAGAELVLSEVFKWLPGGSILAAPVAVSSAPIAIPMAPGNAVITAASQYSRLYSTPTRLTAGYPGVAQVDGKWVDQRV